MRRNSNGISARVLVMAVALTLIIGGIIGGSVAWLTARSDTVVNTFTTSDITVKLEETKGKTSTGTYEFKMVPGCTIDKDPKAWVVEGSEDCILFVKLEWENNTFDNNKSYVTYTIADGWTGLAYHPGVYYRTVRSTEMGESHKFSILKDDKVTVSGDITKEMMNSLTDGTAQKPTLTITAYASQLYKDSTTEFSAAEAWANITPSNP